MKPRVDSVKEVNRDDWVQTSTRLITSISRLNCVKADTIDKNCLDKVKTTVDQALKFHTYISKTGNEKQKFMDYFNAKLPKAPKAIRVQPVE